jgi:hypothetical protein
VLRVTPSLIDDDGFCEAILRAHAVVAPEELHETEAALEHGSAVAQRSLNGLPEAEARVGEGYGSGAGHPLARRAAVADEIGEAEVKEKEEQVAWLVEIPNQMNLLLVKNLETPEEFDRRPQEDSDQDVNGVSEEALAECGERHAIQFVHARGFVGTEAAGRFFGRSGHGIRIEGTTEMRELDG